MIGCLSRYGMCSDWRWAQSERKNRHCRLGFGIPARRVTAAGWGGKMSDEKVEMHDRASKNATNAWWMKKYVNTVGKHCKIYS